MKDVVVGDKVLTANGEYETIFTLNHFHLLKTTNYLQIHVAGLEEEQPIEITPNHMIFTGENDHPVPASQIKVGDSILSAWQGPRKVTHIEVITRDGLYSPLTDGGDGTIIVDGIVASTYTSYTGNTHIETAGGIKLISFHTIMDITCSPYRALCSILPSQVCNNKDEHLFDSGPTTMLRNSMRSFFNIWSEQVFIIQFALFAIYVSVFGIVSMYLKYFWMNFFVLAAWMLMIRFGVTYRKKTMTISSQRFQSNQ